MSFHQIELKMRNLFEIVYSEKMLSFGILEISDICDLLRR